MIFGYCCAKSRKDSDLALDTSDSRVKNLNRILLEFVNEEAKLGMRELDCLVLIEKVLLASNKGEVPKKEVIAIYKALADSGVVNQGAVKNYLIQDFFFTDNTRTKYDFNKLVLFNILYSGGKDLEKANFLFNVMENSASTAVHNHSQKLLATLESMTFIASVAVAEIINSTRRFASAHEDSEFQELFGLYSTNSNMLREFANYVASIFLFPSAEERQYLMREDFLRRVEDCKFLLIKPHELRKKYTEYVWQNQARARLPSRPLKRNTKESFEEVKRPSDASSRQSVAFRESLRHRQYNANRQRDGDPQRKGQSQLQQRQQQSNKMMHQMSQESSMIKYDRDNTSTQSQQQLRQMGSQSQQVIKRPPSNKHAEQTTDFGFSPITSPQHNIKDTQEVEREIASQLAKMTIHKNNGDRESQDTSASLLSTANFKKYGNVHSYLKDMFGDQFLGLVAEMQTDWDEEKSVELQKRLIMVKNQKKLDFPDYNSYPIHVREVFEYFKAFVRKEDLLEFAKGTYFREDIINLYFKILEKVNLLRLSQYNYTRATVRNSIDLYSQQQQPLIPQKIMYLNIGFARKLLNPTHLKDCLNQLQHYFKHDQVLMPFFIDEEDDRRSLIVNIKVADFRVDLYDREREHDNTVLHLLDLASRIQGVEFSEDQIDGGVEGVCVGNDEDMVVAICHIAECVTFSQPADMEVFNPKVERQRILHALLSLLQFE